MLIVRFEKLVFIVKISAKNKLSAVTEMKSATDIGGRKNRQNVRKITDISMRFWLGSDRAWGKGWSQKITVSLPKEGASPTHFF